MCLTAAGFFLLAPMQLLYAGGAVSHTVCRASQLQSFGVHTGRPHVPPMRMSRKARHQQDNKISHLCAVGLHRKSFRWHLGERQLELSAAMDQGPVLRNHLVLPEIQPSVEIQALLNRDAAQHILRGKLVASLGLR